MTITNLAVILLAAATELLKKGILTLKKLRQSKPVDGWTDRVEDADSED